MSSNSNFEVEILSPDFLKFLDKSEHSVSLDYNECQSNESNVKYFRDRFDSVVRDIRESCLSEPGPLAIRIRNYPVSPIPVSLIRSEHIGKLINIDCVVRKISDIKEEIVTAGFRCKTCDLPLPTTYVDYTMRVPGNCVCIDPHHKGTYPDPKLCTYRDVQYVTVQDSDQGQQPRSLPCTISGELLDTLSAGNRCRLTGQVCVRIDTQFGVSNPTLYMEVYDAVKANDDYKDIEITESDIGDIVKAAQDPLTRKHFVDSLAPQIYGYDSVKLALLLQIFGGVGREFDDGSRQRGDSHILLCGDPSVAKSQLIRAAHCLVPRGIYTSGKSTSAAGLTAAATRDERDGKWVLEAGALVLSDGGECVIDEFDKMSDNDRSALHEAMEQQSISVHKAGLNTTLRCRCAVLAAANPKGGRFIDQVDPRDQIDLPPSLISRFDLIFTLIDKPDVAVDTSVSTYVINGRRDCRTGPFTTEFMRKYITYAKSINPVISQEAGDLLQKLYVDLRNNNDTYITLRQLEALMRLCEASARMRLSNFADTDDAKSVIGLFLESLKSLTLSHTIDTGILEGKSKAVMTMEDIICDMLQSGPVAPMAIYDELNKTIQVNFEIVNNVLLDLYDHGRVILQDGRVKLPGAVAGSVLPEHASQLP